MKRVCARLDFAEFVQGELHEHTIMSGGEETTHPFSYPYDEVFENSDERLSYYILRALHRSAYNSPAKRSGDSFDLEAWTYYLNTNDRDFNPVLRRLEQEGAINVIWVPSITTYATYDPTGQLTLLSSGIDFLEGIKNDLTHRRRNTVMPDMEENAFQIARVLFDNQKFGVRRMPVTELLNIIRMEIEEFDVADEFLLSAGYIDGTGSGADRERSLTPSGVFFVKSKLSERFELSYQAETLARYLVDKFREGQSHIFSSQIEIDLEWTHDQLNEFGYELIDEGLAEAKKVAGVKPSAPIAVLGISANGRRAVRRNFRRLEPTVQNILGDQITGDRISVENSGERAQIVVGRNANASQGLSGAEVADLFRQIYEQIQSSSEFTSQAKGEITETVELIEEEAQKGENINEKAVNVHLRNLARMAPDIFDVVVASATNPILGLSTALKKIATKAKEELGNK